MAEERMKGRLLGSQEPYALITALLALAVFWWLKSRGPGLGEAWIFGLGFGFVLQRSRFCFVAAFRDPFITGNTSVARAVVIALMTAVIGMTLVARTGLPLADVHPAGWHTLAGGLLFGTGMVLAGGCASGNLMRVGEGHLQQWIVLFAFIGGSLWGSHDFEWWQGASIGRSPIIFFPHIIGWGPALAFQLLALGAIYLALMGLEKRFFPDFTPAPRERQPYQLRRLWAQPWSYWTGGIALAVLDVLLTWRGGQPWGITTAFSYWGAWIWQIFKGALPDWYYYNLPAHRHALEMGFLGEPRTLLDVGLVIGAFLGSLAGSEFRLHRPRRWPLIAAAVAGGLLMGYGARIAMGCNIGAFFNGIASFSLHGWLFGLGLISGAYVGSRLLLRFLL
ncbi:hypothetical protein MHLNE_04030 [Moorella humiferrea]|uniref:YeeE/YedE family protein n=1 Tax=Neomoorella humiferrea TaxID=676965 RepID=UPI0030D1371F